MEIAIQSTLPSPPPLQLSLLLLCRRILGLVNLPGERFRFRLIQTSHIESDKALPTRHRGRHPRIPE